MPRRGWRRTCSTCRRSSSPATDANSAKLITSDVDPRDHEFLGRERTFEGFYPYDGGLDAAISRGLSFARYADMLWCETSHPDLDEAKRFAEAIHAKYPGKLLAYNCSPSFNWKQRLDAVTIARFQRELGAMGYKFQFVTLAGFHALNLSMFELARNYKESGMTAYSRLQEREFEHEKAGYHAVKHQSFVGTGYFDLVASTVTGGNASTAALQGSTEEEQFQEKAQLKGEGNAMSTGIRVEGKSAPSQDKILTPEALGFIARLQREIGPAREDLLRQRAPPAGGSRHGARLGFLEHTEAVRASHWQVAPSPPDLTDRRVEITGPVERR